MRLCFVSDTHKQHGQLTQHVIAAEADILVHCGDWSSRGRGEEVDSFATWCEMLLRKKYVKHVVAIAGNHDLCMDASHRNDFSCSREVALRHLRDAGVLYLQDETGSIADTDNRSLLFYGSPWTPAFMDWGFQITSEEQDRKLANKIPVGLDVLVTHGPPKGIRDVAPDGRPCGSPGLARAIFDAQPRVHAFGHIHGQYGLTLGRGGTLHVNAASCTEEYKPTNRPIVVDLVPLSARSHDR